DELAAMVAWAEPAPDNVRFGTQMQWDYVFSTIVDDHTVHYAGVLVAPEGNDSLAIRNTLRWTAVGQMACAVPQVTDLGLAPTVAPVRVAVVTGKEVDARTQRPTVAEAVEFYATRTQQACDEGAKLIALPEVCLDWHVAGTLMEKALAVPGPATDRFADLARQYGATIVVGLHERVDREVFNTAAVIDADGSIAGTYHKVHLASFEAFSGVVPGDGFPVFDTAVGRIGCNICMDSSATESSRMVGLNGADFLVLPIMGDHRASVWRRGNPKLDEERWRSIMRVRAMDNQFCMVVARNNCTASCIIDRSGEFLAYNDGTADFVIADVPLGANFRKWNGGCFRQVNWRQRRPHIYGAFMERNPAARARLTDS
ncbi:MAG: carbon-nitrogen hydrolase family protein, partial [Victivallales bacterium]|nr:carbon-nitrogen hydrolase family protein [Victivallales bacterium]